MKGHSFACFLAGLVGGAMFLVFVSAWLNITPQDVEIMHLSSSDFATMLSGFGGAILGAVIGGTISWFQARQTAEAERNYKTYEKNKRLASALMQLQLKTLSLTNASFTIQSWIDTSVTEARNKGKDVSEIWKVVQATASIREGPRFDTEDFLPLVHEKGTPIINEVTMLSERYEASSHAARSFSRLKREFSEFSLPYCSLKPDGQIQAFFPDEVQKTADIKTHEMEFLIRQIRREVEKDVEAGKAACRAIRAFAAEAIEINVPFLNVDFEEATES